ncbi:MAG: hypothetical protein ACR2JO_08010 [Mycobacteriales bacterium]
MSEALCPCGKPTAGGFLCDRCVHTLDVALANIAAYHGDLDTLRTKQARYSVTRSRASVGRTQPLVIDGRWVDTSGTGSEVEYAVRSTVVAWTRVVLDDWPPLNQLHCEDGLCVRCSVIRRRKHPADTIASCCAYLQRMLGRHLSGAEYAPEMLDEMLDLERRLRRLVDSPPERWYAGVCGSVTDTDIGEVVCTRELYADPGSPFVRCGDCGCTYDVEARREVLLAEARDRLATVRTIARIVTTLGEVRASEKRTESRINTWVHRSQLTRRGQRVVDHKPRALYRVGDVLDLLAEDAREESA